ncbi:hypothetical protein C4D60_Mb02t13300 [Musa balbisiana]|uniref:Uncharacterized protein n=1 Tax=Musa balbisiana TaxID=52838 RepID=A0A4S8IAD3_MUSBA|nr:hypothetical protein C4D60_Mb02t13300 [Musa balbisiana]
MFSKQVPFACLNATVGAIRQRRCWCSSTSSPANQSNFSIFVSSPILLPLNSTDSTFFCFSISSAAPNSTSTFAGLASHSMSTPHLPMVEGDLASGSAALLATITTSSAAGKRKPPEHRQFTTIASSSSFPTHERQRTRNVEGECTFPSPKRSHLCSNLGQKKASPQPLNDTADLRAPKAHVNTWVVLLHLLLLLPSPALGLRSHLELRYGPKASATDWSTRSAAPSAAIRAMGRAHSLAPHRRSLRWSVSGTTVVPLPVPQPRERTMRSSTPRTKGNSCLLWRTWVMAAAAGLLIVSPPSTPTQVVERSTDRISAGSNLPGSAHVALHTSHSRKSKLSLSRASAREKTSGAELCRS